MDLDTRSNVARRRELPPLPQQGQRALPAMPYQETVEDAPVIKSRKKKVRRETQTNGRGSLEEPGLEMGGLDNSRTSEFKETPTSDPVNEGHQRRKRKKKVQTIDLEDDQADLVNEEGPEQNTDGDEIVKKTKKKKKSKVTESQLPAELDVEADEIITDDPSSIPQHSLFSAPQGESKPVGKVFVERTKRFQASERYDRGKTSDQSDNFMEFQPQSLYNTRDVALRVHRGFRDLGVFCHGFLAGYAVWNTIVVYVLAGSELTALSNLLEQYHSLAYPSQSLLYMLLAISTVAAFDRMNLAKGSSALREFVTLDPVALASFLYSSALVLSLSQQMTSDRINLYQSPNVTLWPSGSEHHFLHPWLTVNLVVALLVGLAWILIATRPDIDHTEGYLMAMEIKPPELEDKNEVTA